MKKNNVVLLVLIGFIMVALLWLFTSTPEEGLENSKKISNYNDSVIKIGAILPTTGNSAIIGKGEEKGLLLAYDSLKMLYDDYQIDLIIKDYESQIKKVASLATDLIKEDKVSAIITSGTPASEIVSTIAEANNIIQFVFSPDVKITEKSKYNFRVFYNFITEAKVVNDFVLQSGCSKASIIAVNNPAMTNEFDEKIIPFFEKNNIEFIKDYVDPKQQDFRSTIIKHKAYEPCLYLLAPHVYQVKGLTEQLFEAGINTKNSSLLGFYTYNWEKKDYINSLEDFFILAPKFQLQNARANSVAQKLIQRYNTEPTFDIMYAYDNLFVLVDLLVKSKGDMDSFTELFNSNSEYNGASGVINFVGERDTDVEIIISTIQNGVQKELKGEAELIPIN